MSKDTPPTLAPCPDKPNCVSSLEDGEHFIQPITYTGTPESAMARIKLLISADDGATIRQNTEHYLKVEYRSQVFGFIDDVELLLDPANSRFHVRSASRKGYYDFNANRKRIEALRDAFNKA